MPHFSDIMFHAYPEFPAKPSFPSNHLNLPAAFFGLAAFRWMVHITQNSSGKNQGQPHSSQQESHQIPSKIEHPGFGNLLVSGLRAVLSGSTYFSFRMT
jgi:hypothetical protein